MPYVMEFNRSHARSGMAAVADAMGLETEGMSEDQKAGAAIEAVARLFESIGIPRTIADLGITQDQLPAIAEQAMGATRLIKNNPRPLDLQSMTSLVTNAFNGDREHLRD
jgi:alcohol dehydrogenase class IV